ncbi:MAG: hypothetical protein IH948_01050, partial [Bacteroidetes bacterium]|nr:hypothetical protein [Bacteroidota bacterium]
MKKVGILAIIIFCFLVLLQTYWRFWYGSIIIYTQNQDINSSNYSVELLFDNMHLETYTFSLEDIVPHELILNPKLGKHVLLVNRTNLVEEVTVTNYLVVWLVVSIEKDN